MKKQIKNSDNYIVFFLSVLFFWFLINNVPTDIQLHNKYVLLIISNNKSYPPNFLYYFLVNLLSFFTGKLFLINTASVLILSSAVLLRYFITKTIIIEYLQSKKIVYNNSIPVYLSIALLFLFSIQDIYNIFILKKLYLGRIVPTVWHNSTTILLFPFAILLFWKQYKEIINSSKTTISNLLIIALLIVVNAIIKPSFLLVFIPVTVVFLFIKYFPGRIKQLLINLMPLVFGLSIIALLTLLIYYLQIGSFQSKESKIILTKPFEVFSLWVPTWYIPFSLFFSFAFPIIYLAFYPSTLKSNLVKYVLLLTILGVILSAFIGEGGPRDFHGNFSWQNVITCYLLMLVITMEGATRYLKNKYVGLKEKILVLIFAFHILSGVLYIVKIIYTSSYA